MRGLGTGTNFMNEILAL